VAKHEMVAFVLLLSQKVAKLEIVAFVSQKVAKSVERWPTFFDFTKGGQVSKKVANVVRFSRKVAKSVERWPMLCDFRERWPSQ